VGVGSDKLTASLDVTGAVAVTAAVDVTTAAAVAVAVTVAVTVAVAVSVPVAVGVPSTCDGDCWAAPAVLLPAVNLVVRALEGETEVVGNS
jgi:hypothetical protein